MSLITQMLYFIADMLKLVVGVVALVLVLVGGSILVGALLRALASGNY